MTNPAADVIHARSALRPRLAIILGSGLSTLADAAENAVRIPYGDLPGFPASGVSSHRGELVVGALKGTPVMMLAGRAHYYEHGDPNAMRGALQALAAAGVDTLLLTNAAGSLREDMPPGALMMINDHIAFSGRNPLIGEQDDDRFVNMVDAYDPALQAQMRAAAQRLGVALDEGAYMWFSGPSFETPAEIRMARAFGADAVGMSTVPETILARWMGLRVAAVSMITNLGAGMTGRPLSHAETKEEAGKAAANMTRLIAGFAEDFA